MTIVSRTVIVDSEELESIYADLKRYWVDPLGKTPCETLPDFDLFIPFICSYIHLFQRADDVAYISDSIWYNNDLPVISDSGYVELCKLCKVLRTVLEYQAIEADTFRFVDRKGGALLFEVEADEQYLRARNTRHGSGVV